MTPIFIVVLPFVAQVNSDSRCGVVSVDSVFIVTVNVLCMYRHTPVPFTLSMFLSL